MCELAAEKEKQPMDNHGEVETDDKCSINTHEDDDGAYAKSDSDIEGMYVAFVPCFIFVMIICLRFCKCSLLTIKEKDFPAPGMFAVLYLRECL